MSAQPEPIRGLVSPVAPPLVWTVTVSSLARLKRADTLLAVSMVTVQAPVPLQAPSQPTKTESAAGVAVRVTTVLRA